MFELSSYDIKVDLLKELKDYLPNLLDLILKLKSGDDEEGDLEEFHRLIDTIRGATSLVKLEYLNKIASELKATAEDMLQNRLEMNDYLYNAMHSALIFIDQYYVNEDGSDSVETAYFSNLMANLKKNRNAGRSSPGLDPLLKLYSRDESNQREDDQYRKENLETENHKFDDTEFLIDEVADFAEINFEDPPLKLEKLEIDDSVNLNQNLPYDSEDEWEAIDLPQDELLEGFYQEAEDHFQNLGNALAQLESQITGPTTLTPDQKELLRLIRRAVHTIKGAAAVIRLTDIAAWGHEFEDLLDWLFEKADQINSATLGVVADAADILERLVSSPQDVNSEKQTELRSEFRRIIGDGKSVESDTSGSGDTQLSPLPRINEKDEDITNEDRLDDYASQEPAFPTSVSKTLRVEMDKVEALVNLASELIIALSGFDENMNSLNAIIGELDRSRLRLKGTARDLETGYELKAIRDLNSYQQKIKAFKKTAEGEFTDFDLLELDRYSEFNLLIRSLNETAVDVNTISAQLSHVHRGFKSYFNRLRILLSDLQEKVMRVRMTPMSSIINRLRSTVRETAAKLHKNVRLTVTGEEIELDKRVWETLADPLMHLLRNAIDHGIETPEIRKAMNKTDLATIQLTAAYQGNQVFLRVIDDGAGIDIASIRQKAEGVGIDIKEKSDRSISELIFHQGFSTRKDVSQISGRGVGLDVVQENIASLKGSVHIEKTDPGNGTIFLIRIPLTLAVMRSLIFEVNGRLYATALYDIQEMLRIHPRDLEAYRGKAIRIGDQVLPFFQMSDILPRRSIRTPTKDPAERMLVLVINTGTWHGVVSIDKMHTQKEIVVKSLGNHLQHVRGVSGATIMGDGKVIPILNLETLLGGGSIHLGKIYTPAPAPIQNELDILVIDDSVSVRMVISRLIQRQGWVAQTAKDGVEAVELLHQYKPDLVILDIEMPRMNGYEFMRTFRNQDKFSKTPVIMLTSRSAQKHRDKAEDLGVNAFLVKPFEDRSFINLIKKLTTDFKSNQN